MTCHNIKGELKGFILKMDYNARIQAAGENESEKKMVVQVAAKSSVENIFGCSYY